MHGLTSLSDSIGARCSSCRPAADLLQTCCRRSVASKEEAASTDGRAAAAAAHREAREGEAPVAVSVRSEDGAGEGRSEPRHAEGSREVDHDHLVAVLLQVLPPRLHGRVARRAAGAVRQQKGAPDGAGGCRRARFHCVRCLRRQAQALRPFSILRLEEGSVERYRLRPALCVGGDAGERCYVLRASARSVQYQ